MLGLGNTSPLDPGKGMFDMDSVEGLQLWYNADHLSLVTIADDAEVTTWRNAAHLSQDHTLTAASGKKPLIFFWVIKNYPNLLGKKL